MRINTSSCNVPNLWSPPRSHTRNETFLSNNNVHEYRRRVKVLPSDALIAGFLSRQCFLTFPAGRENPDCPSVSHPRRPKNWSTMKCMMIVIMHRHVKQIYAEPPETGPRAVRTIIKPSQRERTAFTVLGFRCYFFLPCPLGQPPGKCGVVTRAVKS